LYPPLLFEDGILMIIFPEDYISPPVTIGYGDPPLPIPNREVKAIAADDTYAFGRRESRYCRRGFVLMR
jgi:hypothetical protein